MHTLKRQISAALVLALVALLVIAPASQALHARFPSSVKSVQHLSQAVTVSNSSGTVDVTIASVDTTKSVILATSTLNASGNTGVIGANFTSSTNVRLYWQANGATTVTVRFAVIEFYEPSLVQVISGQTSGNATITSAATAKTMIFPAWWNWSGVSAYLRANQSNATTIAWEEFSTQFPTVAKLHIVTF